MNKSHKYRLIYLTGFMASGKSTIAPILANCLGYGYYDLDAEIEKSAGKNIRAIFNEAGEPAFRGMEHAKLVEISKYTDAVISLGGGTVLQDANLELITSTGLLIYLKADPAQLFRRLKHKKDRPILQAENGESLSDQELRNRIETLLDKRESCYAKADLVIQTDNKPVGKTVDEIVKQLQKII